MNKVKLYIFIALGVLSGTVPISVFAQTRSGKPILGVPSIQPIVPAGGLIGVIERIQGFLFGLLLSIAAIFILYAAYIYLTSGGNETAVGSAKKIIIYAVVAIFVAALSEGLVVIIKFLLGVRQRASV